jgi:hypothetical protein
MYRGLPMRQSVDVDGVPVFGTPFPLQAPGVLYLHFSSAAKHCWLWSWVLLPALSSKMGYGTRPR